MSDHVTLFNEWFEVNNKEHMKAYAEYLQECQRWPKHFIPADVSLEKTWQQTLNHRIVGAYVKLMTAGPVYRNPEPRPKPEFS